MNDGCGPGWKGGEGKGKGEGGRCFQGPRDGWIDGWMGSGTGGKEGRGACSLFFPAFFVPSPLFVIFCRLTPAVYSFLCLLLFLICAFALSSPLLSPQAIFGVVGLCNSRPVVIKRASIYLSFCISLPPVLTFVPSIFLKSIPVAMQQQNTHLNLMISVLLKPYFSLLPILCVVIVVVAVCLCGVRGSVT
ncbi:hypothetical protein B0T26DRAFT_182505 [Lasiosphaeria miniovina]|uniref:Transmembrane protein n=1 Tax=Lasiosphaeria miniovina TaxID=1954250 RepID=A0AA40E596_9PEZI|nr:uncharacterized protein B0T26DRAFT_182505 [Lasiosphaeria miniovina]KAK0728689.1 hypothetical protein B0T26DRAFT_182505 [Lasiosphaeria miniovina]